MTEHTKTPWIAKPAYNNKYVVMSGGVVIAVFNRSDKPKWNKANAEFIVKAVNSHDELVTAATKWPRCCDLWQDGLGGMHCQDCSQKTFAMLREIQKILGVDKGGKALEKAKVT